MVGLDSSIIAAPSIWKSSRNMSTYIYIYMHTHRDDMVGLDSSIIAAPSIWKSSGHVDGFSDPMVDCKVMYACMHLYWLVIYACT